MNTITPYNISTNNRITYTSKTQRQTNMSPTNGIDKVEKIGGTNINEKPTKMLLSLLKSALNDEPVDQKEFKDANYSDWQTMLNISKDSSVTGIALDATNKLPQNTIPKDIEMKMLEIQKESEIRHAKQEKILGELSETFAKKGIETIQLKGIGLSMNYPEPTHRFGGDIDIFTRLKGTQTQDHSNAYETINNMMENKGLEVDNHNHSKKTKHSEFDYKGVRIENHRYFINKERMPEAVKLDEYLHKSLNPHIQKLPNGTKILVPSKEFNTIFLAHHAYQHFIFGGIDIHHLTDWSTHIKKNGLEFPNEAKNTKFEKFTYALTNLSNRYLGTNVKVPEDKKFEDKIFNMLLHPEEKPIPKDLNKAELLVFKTKRFIKRAKQSKEYTGESYFKTFARTFINKMCDPASLFKRI